MDLTYIDYFSSTHKHDIKKIYKHSFPKEERFPFWILKHCSKEENVIFNAILDKNKVIGISYIITYDTIAYFMYLAIDENLRGKGYGSKVLQDFIKKYKTIILSIERPNKDIEDNRNIRKQFYLRNGFFETNKFIEDTGVEYEILCTNKDHDITIEDLEKRYSKMANSTIMKYLIGKIFDMQPIDFIE